MDIIEKCKNILIEYEEIVFAYIFGSYVQGTLRADSDLDIAIYLKEEIDAITYLDMKTCLTEACKREVDLIILNDATPLLKYQIYKNNKLLFSRDKAMENRYKVKILFEYNDMKRYLDLSYERTIDRLNREVRFDG